MAAFENRQTEPKPNRITNDEDKYKSSIVKVQPGLKPNSEQKVEHILIAPPYCQTASFVQYIYFDLALKKFHTSLAISMSPFCLPTVNKYKLLYRSAKLGSVCPPLLTLYRATSVPVPPFLYKYYVKVEPSLVLLSAKFVISGIVLVLFF